MYVFRLRAPSALVCTPTRWGVGRLRWLARILGAIVFNAVLKEFQALAETSPRPRSPWPIWVSSINYPRLVVLIRLEKS